MMLPPPTYDNIHSALYLHLAILKHRRRIARLTRKKKRMEANALCPSLSVRLQWEQAALQNARLALDLRKSR